MVNQQGPSPATSPGRDTNTASGPILALLGISFLISLAAAFAIAALYLTATIPPTPSVIHESNGGVLAVRVASGICLGAAAICCAGIPARQRWSSLSGITVAAVILLM